MILKNEEYLFYIKLIKILIFLSYAIFLFNKQITRKIKRKNNVLDPLQDIKIKLNSFTKFRKPTYIIFSDYYTSKYCSDINAYTVFEYYLSKNYNN